MFMTWVSVSYGSGDCSESTSALSISVEIPDDKRFQILITRVEHLPRALAAPRHEPLTVYAARDVGEAVPVEIREPELRQRNRREIQVAPCLRHVIPNEPLVAC